MIDYLKGTLEDKNNLRDVYLTVDVQGVGYQISVISRDFEKASLIGDKIKIYTFLVHKEDSMSLFGFLNKEDRDIFKILISVSGVGPKMGLTLLDEFEASELIPLVISGNFKELTRAKGVGAKLAQKIILELKDKLTNIQNTMPVFDSAEIDFSDRQAISDAQTVLVSLGYDREEIKQALSNAAKTSDSNNAEEILKESLKFLSVTK